MKHPQCCWMVRRISLFVIALALSQRLSKSYRPCVNVILVRIYSAMNIRRTARFNRIEGRAVFAALTRLILGASFRNTDVETLESRMEKYAIGNAVFVAQKLGGAGTGRSW